MRQNREPTESASDESIFGHLVEANDPERRVVQAQLVSVYKASFEQAFRALDPRDRTLLRLCVIDRLSIDALARVLGVHRATAARQAAAARERLVAAVRAQIAESTHLTEGQIDTSFGLIESQIDLSIERVFGRRSEERERDPR
jgi:RNA polymerase sigma-70 factor (ECF subfamily)